MIQQAKAKIFLADQRGINENNKFRSRPTFNFGDYFNEHKQAFAGIYVLNDDTLAGGSDLKMLVKECSHIVFIPVAGAINYKDAAGNTQLIVAGQSQLVDAGKGLIIEISNPFSEAQVNFLQIWIRANTSNREIYQQPFIYNDVNENLNTLVKAIQQNETQLPFSVSIGKFSGRGETVYTAKNKNSGLFIFVIEGAFEVEGRLLHAGDGLALWETAAAEMEALSNDAIIIAIEIYDTSAG